MGPETARDPGARPDIFDIFQANPSFPMRRLILAYLFLSLLLPLAQPVASPDVATPRQAEVREVNLTPLEAVGVSLLVPTLSVASGVGLLALDSRDPGPVPFVLILGGIAVGPSAGNLVQREWRDAAIGAVLLSTGTCFTVYSVSGNIATQFNSDALTERQEQLAEVYGVIGPALMFVGAGYALVSAAENAIGLPATDEVSLTASLGRDGPTGTLLGVVRLDL